MPDYSYISYVSGIIVFALFMTSLFYVEYSLQGLSMALHMLERHSLLWLNNIPLCAILHFVSPSVDGHLGYLHFLAIAKNAINYEQW